ncbi:MAG: hypothetical protein ACTSXP_05325 [Promethearchaeota archaeon]
MSLIVSRLGSSRIPGKGLVFSFFTGVLRVWARVDLTHGRVEYGTVG